MADKLVLPDELNIGQAYDPCMSMTTVEEATPYLEALIERSLRLGHCTTFEEAKELHLSNIGYYAGYCSSETRVRVNQLFGAVHPIFGNDYAPSPEKALKAGMEYAKKH